MWPSILMLEDNFVVSLLALWPFLLQCSALRWTFTISPVQIAVASVLGVCTAPALGQYWLVILGCTACVVLETSSDSVLSNHWNIEMPDLSYLYYRQGRPSVRQWVPSSLLTRWSLSCSSLSGTGRSSSHSSHL